MRLRVYADRSHYEDRHRKALNDIFKAFWNDKTAEERRATYGNRQELFEVVDRPELADLHVLTMKWQHYVELDRVDQALRAVELARKLHRPIAVFSLSDFEANFPVGGADIHLFQASAYRSRHATSNHGMPAFFEDPLQPLGGVVQVRPRGPRAVLGFCGQAGSTRLRHLGRRARNQLNLIRWRLGMLRWEPPPFEHTQFRQEVLQRFADSSEVETRFVLRARYRAGLGASAMRDAPAERTRQEFIQNILDTDYTVSVRGAGNFSVRFYEALALGRIPVFIDTDCVLPYHDRVDWRRYTVWIDRADLTSAPTRVAEFHERMTEAEFRERQLECRRLWEDRLCPDGFYAHFIEHFPELQSR